MSSTVETNLISQKAKSSVFSRFLRRWALQIALSLVALAIWGFFFWRSPVTFKNFAIYNSLMLTTPFYALVAIPLTLIVIVKEMDLSFPSVMAWGVAAYDLTFRFSHNVWLGFIACLLAGLVAGLLNGYIVVRLGVPSLVATIGTQFLWRGVVLVTTNGQGVGMQEVKTTILYPLLVGKLGPIPLPFIWTLIFGLIAWFFLNRHKYGAHVYLTGDNAESARLMGVNTARTKILAFAAVGVMAAFAGFVVSEQLLFFWPTLGDGYMLNTLASVFLGGTSVFGGTATEAGSPEEIGRASCRERVSMFV
jgi:simple sugar transport system permease protein